MATAKIRTRKKPPTVPGLYWAKFIDTRPKNRRAKDLFDFEIVSLGETGGVYRIGIDERYVRDEFRFYARIEKP